jgi:uncharacterized protein (UPF0335 family)
LTLPAEPGSSIGFRSIKTMNDAVETMNPQTAQQLKSIIERIERLEEEKKALGDDIKEVYAEAKGNGFDAKILRKVVSIRKQETAERVEQEQLIDLYLMAVGTKD